MTVLVMVLVLAEDQRNTSEGNQSKENVQRMSHCASFIVSYRSTGQDNTIQYRVQDNTVQYSTIQYNTVQDRTIKYMYSTF